MLTRAKIFSLAIAALLILTLVPDAPIIAAPPSASPRELNGSAWRTYTVADGLGSNYVMDVAVDEAGHIWLGRDSGLSEFDGSTWRNYYGGGAYYSSIAVDRAGHIWAGLFGFYSCGGLKEFDGYQWHTYTTNDGLPSNCVTDIAIDNEGHKWFATQAGVSVFDGGTWHTYTSADGLVDNDVYAVAIDEAGHKWFGTYNGLSEFDGTTWTTYTPTDGLPIDYIRAIAIDAVGHIWVGTQYYGVSEFDGAVWRTYTTDDGLASNGIRAIAADEKGRKWFGTDGGGVSVFDGSFWRTYTIDDGLANNWVSSIAIDEEVGHVWFGTSNGVSEFTPPPCDLSKQPVLLIHGWGGPDDLDQDETGFKQLYQWMQADGYVEGCNLFYATGVKASNNRIFNAIAIQLNLQAAYNTITALNPDWRGHFDIIGHSYGGLNARFYLESSRYTDDANHGQYGIHVDNLFTLGSPHGGAIVPGELFPGTILIGLGHLNDEELLSALDLLADKMYQYNLSHSQPDDVCYRPIGGDFMQQPGLWWKAPIIWALYEIWTDIPNDIGVSRRSSLQLGTKPDLAPRYGHVVTYANTDMHGYKDMLGLGAVRSYVSPTLTYNEIIAPNLGASMDRCHSSQVNTRSAVDAQSEELTIPPLLIASDDITGGQTTTGTVPVDWDGQTAFYVTWMSGGDLDLTLRDPAGAVFTPTVAISDPNADYGKLIFSTSGLATYIFTNTLTGAWTYTLTAASGPYPIPFDLYVNPDSPLVARASVPEWQPFGAPAVITASLFYSTTPVSGATVQAHVTHPNGGEGSISLRDDGLPPDNTAGDGIYSGTYTDTTTGGFYYVLVEADGTYASQTYHRTAQTVFPVAADSATLSDTYDDQPNDENGDGLYEYLGVNVGVNATQQGDFTVAAVLQGEGGQYIDLANTTVYSFTGATTLTLRFDGQAIRASGLDGPYTVTEVLLLDEAALIKLDEADNVWVTPAYDHRQFGVWPGYNIYLPLVLRDSS